ncbi:MAG: radical SAM protein [Blastocatellia bacterium]|jgi:7-carboxy-7-deazaguanine synthase|nr:radical SAM protein [Blastocatellia bacterium]
MRITEIYKSIQGESTWAGMPCIFVRTNRCDLRCTWCDSAFTFTGGVEMSVEAILAEVERLGPGIVEITGGEPMLQRDIDELARRMCDAGRTVLIETGGHRDIGPEVLDPRVIRIMDVKCPGSGESDKNRWENLELLRATDEVKFVLTGRADYEWARDVIRQHGLEGRTIVLMSVAHGQVEPREVVEWMLEDGLRARFQMQMHKVIWEHAARGV